MRGILRSSMVVFLCRPGLIIGEAVSKFDSLIGKGFKGPQNNRCLLVTHEYWKPKVLQVKVAAKRA